MVLVEKQLLEAMRHPLRRRLLIELADAEASPCMLSRSLGEPLGTVSYHTRKLRDIGCIELVRAVPRRGAIEHYYRAVTAPLLGDEVWEQLSPAARRELTRMTLSDISRELSGALAQGRFDSSGAHVVRIPLALDAAGWRELSALVEAFIADVAQLKADVEARSPAREDRTPSALSLLHCATAAS